MNLEQRIRAAGDPLTMLLTNAAEHGVFKYPPEWSGWASEEWARRNTAVIFDQTTHQADTYVNGHDAKRLLSDVAINSPSRYTPDRARQVVAVNPSGEFIGDSILATLAEDRLHISGVPALGNWIAYQAEAGGYDVEVVREDSYPFDHFTGGAKNYRFQLTGPATKDIVEAALGRPMPALPFFGVADVVIGGHPARLLNHTMAAQAGEAHSGVEVWGPIADSQEVLDALLAAGRGVGLQRGGVHAYMSQNLESSGWPPLPLPAIYSAPELRPYREQLSAFGLEGMLALEGSYRPGEIEAYYASPWDLGYDRLISFDHDFVGRSALERQRDEPHKRKVWLEWNEDDVIRTMRSSLFGAGDDRPKILGLPMSAPMTAYYDEVRDASGTVGHSSIAGYTTNIRRYVSLAFIESDKAIEGAQVEILWGEPDAGERAFMNPPHTQSIIRAVVRTEPLPER